MSKKFNLEKVMRKGLESEAGREQLRGAMRAKALLTLPPEYRELAKYDAEVMADIAAAADARVLEMAEAMEERDRLSRAVKACGGEECRKKGRKMCMGCCVTLYCSKECQDASWSRHKVECKEVRKEFKTVELKKGFRPPGHPLNKPYMNTMAKGYCVVQIEEITMETEYEVEVRWFKPKL